MARLISRQKFIPGGFQFVQPEIRWQSTRYASFDSIVNSLISARQGNPAQAKKLGWRTDYNSVADEVDAFNARICEINGWTDYITGGNPAPPPPKAQALLNPKQLSVVAGHIKKIWSGAKTLNAWLDSGEPPVETALSEARAAICVKCSKNQPGDWTKWFTLPASQIVKKQLERLTERKIFTSQDAKLNCCEVCLCPMKVKVHCPAKFIKGDTLPEVMAELKQVPECWVPKECGA